MATVETLINNAQTYVSSVQELADDAIGQMRLDVANVGFTAISFSGISLPEEPEVPDVLQAPDLSPISL